MLTRANKTGRSPPVRRTVTMSVWRNPVTSVWMMTLLLAVMLPLVTAGLTDKLVFSRELEDVTGTAGQRLELPCEVVGRGRGDQSQCVWSLDGQELAVGGSPRLRQEGCSLVLDPLLVEDEGSYRCLAGDGLTSQPAKVTVYAEPGRPYIAQAREGNVLDVEEGQTVMLECSRKGANPAAELVWQYGNRATEGFDIREEVSRMEDGKTWKTSSTFRFVPLEDQQVVCSVHTERFPKLHNSRPLQLRLTYKPRVVLTSSMEKVKEGQSVTFTCGVTASPADVTYTWFLNDNEIPEQTEAVLTVERVGRELHGAVVKCKVENSVGAGERTLELVMEYERRILEHPQSVTAREGETMKMECLAEGSPSPQYAWVRLGEGLREEVVGVSPTLVLPATPQSEGQYVCMVFISGLPSLRSKTATLALVRAPTVELQEVVTARLGEAVVLQCKVVTLSDNTSVVWTKHPALGNLDSLRQDMTRQRVVKGETVTVIHSELILPSLGEADFSTYGCFAQNEAGTDYRMLALEREQDTDWISLVIAINTLLGLMVLAALLVWHFRKRPDREAPCIGIRTISVRKYWPINYPK